MIRTWWRVLAQRIAYPRWWPTCVSFYKPQGDERFPPYICMSIDGKLVGYVLDGVAK